MSIKKCAHVSVIIYTNTPAGVALTPAAFRGDYYINSTFLKSLNNKDASARYLIRARRTYWVKKTIAAVVEFQNQTIDLKRKRGKRTSYLLGKTGSATDIDSGALYILAYSDAGPAVNGISVYTEGYL
jgi:hypothetical protein